MRVLLNQIKIETKLFLRYKETVFWNFAFPVFFMVLFGLIGFGGDRVQYINFLLPGIIVMALMTTCIISTAIDIVSDRAKGIFRRLFVTPLPKSVLLGGKIINRYVIVLLQTILLNCNSSSIFWCTDTWKLYPILASLNYWYAILSRYWFSHC